MNEFLTNLPPALMRTTLFLAIAAIVVRLLLSALRSSSPRVHRVAWCLVLLQGWLLLRLSVTIPYYEAPTPQLVRGLSQADREPGRSGKPKTENGLTYVADETRYATMAVGERSARVSPNSTYPTILALCWLGGMGLLAVWSLIGYVRFVRRLPPGQPAQASWTSQWEALLAEHGIGRKIPLRVTTQLGPLLCRLPSGCQLLIPCKLWQRLKPAERLSVLRHELAHYQRGDDWKSLAARLLILPHWFNPFAWWAIRKFDEAAEWACDQQAAGTDRAYATDYARALLRLGDASYTPAVYSPAARGHGLAVRIRRLLTSGSFEDSTMKKVLVLAVVLAVSACCVVRVDLVAKPAAADQTSATAPAEENPFLDPTERRQHLARQIERLGGTLQPAPSADVEPSINIVLKDSAVTDDQLKLLNKLPHVQSLDLSHTQITDAGLVHLKDLVSLRHLDLTGTKVTDAGMAHLRGLHNLESLGIGDTEVTAAGLSQLEDPTDTRWPVAGGMGGGFAAGGGGSFAGPTQPGGTLFPKVESDDNVHFAIVAVDGKAKIDAKQFAVLFEGVPMTPGIRHGYLQVFGPGSLSWTSGYFVAGKTVMLEDSYADELNTLSIKVGDRRHVLKLSDRGTRLEVDGKQTFELGEKKTFIVIDSDGAIRTVDQIGGPEVSDQGGGRFDGNFGGGGSGIF